MDENLAVADLANPASFIFDSKNAYHSTAEGLQRCSRTAGSNFGRFQSDHQSFDAGKKQQLSQNKFVTGYLKKKLMKTATRFLTHSVLPKSLPP